MNIINYCLKILNSPRLEDKLECPDQIIYDDYIDLTEVPLVPARDTNIQFSSQNTKFPKNNTLTIPDKKALAFSCFANHELLAIEIMAYTILKIPHRSEEDIRFKKGILATIKDEQRHFKLYQKRMAELGYSFGDFPLNNFFWKQTENIKDKESYIAIMAMTFESANLDFALYYRDIFTKLGDHHSAKIMDEVYQDEITHVAFGVNYLNRWKEDQTLWEYYQSILPWPMTPARSKGKSFNEHGRIKAKLDSHFIKCLKEYRDDFKITDRKEWKNESL